MDKDKKQIGIKKGFKYPKTVRKIAVKNLEKIVLNENAPVLAQAIASSRLLDEIKP